MTKDTSNQSLEDDFQMDRSVVVVADLHHASDDVAYWASKTPGQRLRALEISRQIVYGCRACSGQLQKVIEITTRPKR